jgi:hypothetical protein
MTDTDSCFLVSAEALTFDRATLWTLDGEHFSSAFSANRPFETAG